jgi:AcrR family transcriptional regulator
MNDTGSVAGKGGKMTAYESIKQSFKELTAVSSVEKITVASICERAKVSRKTFYTNFIDKIYVMERIFYDDVIQPFRDLRNELEMVDKYKARVLILLERFYYSIYVNKEFYTNIISYSGQNSFKSFVLAEITKINREILEHYQMPQVEKEYMAYFFAASQTMLLIKWIQDKMIIPPKQMAAYYSKWAMRHWTDMSGEPERKR